MCHSCGYELRIDPSDSPHLKALAELTSRFKRSDVTPEAYRAALDTSETQLIHDLKALTDTWRCPVCGEENPGGFEECWKCRNETAIPEGDETPQSGDGSDVPGFRKGGNAWEQ